MSALKKASWKLVMSLKLTLTIIAGLLLAGCSMEDPRQGASKDLRSLREIVDLQIPTESAQWEIFGTPEHKGGVPGPTDFVTLVAELRASDPRWIETNTHPAGMIYVTPEAARPWLSEPFHRMLLENQNTIADFSRQANCRKYETILKKTGTPVQGFVCAEKTQLLIYLILSSANVGT